MMMKFDYKSDNGDSLPNLSPASVSSGASDSSYLSHHESHESIESLNSCCPPKEIPIVYKKTSAKVVSFGDVEIRTYPVILGDHPDCVGPPIAFDWDYVREERVDLEQFEAERPPRRHDEELILDWFLRKRLLRCYAGVTEEEMSTNAKEMLRIRKQRDQTRKSIQFKSNARHLLSKATMGLFSEKSLKHKDREVHANRYRMNEHQDLVPVH